MPLPYDIPLDLLAKIDAGQAQLFNAIIKDTATGRILGHVQETSALRYAVGRLIDGTAAGVPLSPLDFVSVVQNQKIVRGITELQHGMLLVQNLQVGLLAMSGLGLGVSLAGFAVTIRKLKDIGNRLEAMSEQIERVTTRRRDDELHALVADVTADLENVESLAARNHPQRVAEQLQLSLSRASQRLEKIFLEEADISSLTSLPPARIDRLWSLSVVIQICHEAIVTALFAADELEVAQRFGAAQLERQMGLHEIIIPDAFSRLVSRGERDEEKARQARIEALAQAHVLSNGIRGSIERLAGQASIAESLQQQGISGIEFLRTAEEAEDAPLIFLASAA